MQLTSKERIKRRHLRIRKKVNGSAERPRLFVRKSLKHVYAQVIDDTPEGGSRTIAIFTTATKQNAGKQMRNIANASALGKSVGEELKKLGISAVVFDRGGYLYHGCIKAVAEGVRESGITI